MTLTKKVGLGLIALLIVAVLAIWLFQAQIISALFDRAVQNNITRDTMAELSDGLHVGLCGTGSPMPNADRAGPCTIVVAGEQIFVVDIGEGGNRNIALMGFDASEISGVFLTHFHSDHFDGLGPLQLFHWTRGASKAPLPVYGPTGVEAIVEGFSAAYATDDTYRIAHHGEEIVPPSGGGSEARAFEMDTPAKVVLEKGDLIVTAFEVDHTPVEPAVGYRFDYKGRSLCISGDTVRSSNLEAACKGVDVLVHEALQPALVGRMGKALAEAGNPNAAHIMEDIQDYHASPEDAAVSATETGAKMLVLSHLVPPMPNALLYPTFLGEADRNYDGPIIIGEDGMLFSLPAGDDKIEEAQLF